MSAECRKPAPVLCLLISLLHSPAWGWFQLGDGAHGEARIKMTFSKSIACIQGPRPMENTQGVCQLQSVLSLLSQGLVAIPKRSVRPSSRAPIGAPGQRLPQGWFSAASLGCTATTWLLGGWLDPYLSMGQHPIAMEAEMGGRLVQKERTVLKNSPKRSASWKHGTSMPSCLRSSRNSPSEIYTNFSPIVLFVDQIQA